MDEEKWIVPSIEVIDFTISDVSSPIINPSNGCGSIPSYQVACDKLVCCN